MPPWTGRPRAADQPSPLENLEAKSPGLCALLKRTNHLAGVGVDVEFGGNRAGNLLRHAVRLDRARKRSAGPSRNTNG